MTARRLTPTEVERFAYGEADELEEIILSDPEYLATVEEIWAEEMPRDLRAPVLRALQLEQFVSGVLGATLDLTFKAGEAMSHYLEVSIDDPPGE
jgi:hypothetical protein